MPTEIYMEALLVDEEAADQIWEVWDKGEIDDQEAWLAWWVIAFRPLCPPEADVELIGSRGAARDPFLPFAELVFNVRHENRNPHRYSNPPRGLRR